MAIESKPENKRQMNKKLFRDTYVQGLVEQLLARTNAFNAASASSRNITDPFAAALESALFGLPTKDAWESLEVHRQKQKNLMNHIGLLHQDLIGGLEGWKSYDAGSDQPDVVGSRGSQKIIGEVKNKHNTMNARSSEATYDKLAEQLASPEYKGYVGVVIQVLGNDQRPGRNWKPFAPGASRHARNDIVVMSGKVFYAIATDSDKRQINQSVTSTTDMTRWESWGAFKQMATEVFDAITKVTDAATPTWIRQIFEDFNS
jgi:hypothetical protein